MRELTERCMPASCPAVFEDGDDLVIIGAIVPEQVPLGGRIAPHEEAVRISKAMVIDALRKLEDENGRTA